MESGEAARLRRKIVEKRKRVIVRGPVAGAFDGRLTAYLPSVDLGQRRKVREELVRVEAEAWERMKKLARGDGE